MRKLQVRTGLTLLGLVTLTLCGTQSGAQADGYGSPVVIAQGGPIVREIIEQRPPVVREVIVHDDVGDRAFRLHEGCQAGDRGACVKFGMLIGQHQERRAEWQHAHPDMFWWDR